MKYVMKQKEISRACVDLIARRTGKKDFDVTLDVRSENGKPVEVIVTVTEIDGEAE